MATPEQAQDSRRIHPSLYPPIVEPTNHMPPLQYNTINIFFHLRQLGFDFFNQSFRQILVRIEPQNPFRHNRQIVQRPLKLHCLIAWPFVLDEINSWSLELELEKGIDYHFCIICGEAVENEDLAGREGKKPPQAPLDMELLVLREDYNGKISHLSTLAS